MSLRSVKVVVVGDGGVGKTSLLMRYTRHTFPTEYVPTVFDNFSERMVVNGQPIDVGLWDTAGQESYDKLRPLAYPNTDVFIVCYSIGQPESLDNIGLKWMQELREHVPMAKVLLVATQSDKRDQLTHTLITSGQGVAASKRLGSSAFMECSALTGEGVADVFQTAVLLALDGDERGKKRRRWTPRCLRPSNNP